MIRRSAAAALFLLAPLTAQRPVDGDEFLHLEHVLQSALQKAGPFVVTVETFGGTRRLMGKDGPMDGPAPPKPRPRPEPVEKPEPKPDELPEPADPNPEQPEQPEQPQPVPMPEKGDEKKDEKKKLPLVAPGFQQTLG
jgi:outer membrane biosynthesis protein TonB